MCVRYPSHSGNLSEQPTNALKRMAENETATNIEKGVVINNGLRKGVLGRNHHHREISYGTFIPYFVIDSEYLNSLLTAEKGYSCELEETASAESSQPLFPPEITSSRPHSPEGVLSQSVPSPVNLNSCSINDYNKPSFFTECELQVRKLFSFMDLHLSKVESDLRELTRKPKAKRGEKDDLLEKEEESLVDSEKTKLLDSGIEEDHMQTNVGILSRLKDVVVHLQDSLQSSFSSLDELVQVHDDNSLSYDGRNYLQSKEAKRNEFDCRLNGCLTTINSKLEACEDLNSLRQRKLRKESVLTTEVRETPISWFTVLYAFLFLAMWVILCFMYYWKRPEWVVFLRLLRSPILVVFYLYLFATNIKVWANTKIDYVSIFDYPPKGVPTPKYIFKVAGIFTVFFSILLVTLLAISTFSDDIPGKIIALLMWFMLLGFLINPLDRYLRKGRMSFMLVVVRVLLAPLHFVYFGDFWFADQLNSTVAILLDVQYLVCYVVSDTWAGDVNTEVCTTSSNGIRPIISCLPALWRFFQCLRCFYDTRNSKHLINAGKYSTTFPVIVFATMFSVRVPRTFSLTKLDYSDVSWIVICWLICSLLHAIYTFAWDVYCDWGLMRLSHRTLLRPNLLYRPKFIYFIAMFIDLILRFAWIFKLSLAIVWHLDSDLIYTGLIVAEMFRRFVWNFFRVEYEQVCRQYPD